MWMVVDLIALLIIVAYAAIGFFRGFSEFLFQVISLLITIGVVFFAYKPVANVVMDTQLDEKIYSVVYENLANTPIAEGEEINTENTNMSKGIVSTINGYIAEAKENAEQNVLEFVSNKIAIIVVYAITAVALFVIVHLVLFFIRIALDIMGSMPLLREGNQVLGLVIGVVKGILLVYLLLALASGLSPILSRFGIIDAIESSKVSSILYNNNIIIDIIHKLG
jgi:uncharacterized membrane protein required for colicin V production